MAGKTDVFSNDLLKLIFNGVAITGIADNASAAPLATLYVGLHTADPTDTPANGQAQYEANYTGYARVGVARNSGAWVVTGKTVSPASNIDFPVATAGVNTATHWSIGTAPSGAGKVLYVGSLSPAVLIQTGVIPRVMSTSTVTEE